MCVAHNIKKQYHHYLILSMKSGYQLQLGRAKLVLMSLLLSWLGLGDAWAQSRIRVRGIVTDDKKEALIGANVRIKGQDKGTSTDLDGKFVLEGVAPNATLVISFIGMTSREVPVAGKSELTIMLQPESSLLDDVVVVAYGRQKKVNLTGSVSTLDAKALEARPVVNVTQALQGLIPGLNLTTNNSGGALNSSMNINIRGAGTIGDGSSASPLVLIDGVEGNMNTLSPNDIENISVLKDAASSAIYGSRAAFGVILITTKSGKSGKTRISYNGNMRLSTAIQLPRMMDSEMFANYWNVAGANSGDGIKFNDDMMERIRAYKYGDFSKNPDWKYGTEWDPKAESIGAWAMYLSSWANTDWFAEQYRKNVPSHEHNLSISGGTDKINYYLSGAILDQQGLIRYGRDEFRRFNFTGKISAQLNSWLNVSYTQRWVREEYERPSYMTSLFFHNIARRWPTNPIRDPNGNLVAGNETIQMRDGGVDRNQRDFVNHQLNLLLKPIEGLTINLENNYNTTYNNNHWDVLAIYDYLPDGTPRYTKRADADAGLSQVAESAYKNTFFNGRYYAQYARLFDEKHDVRIMVGSDVEINNYRHLGGNKRDLITPLLPTVNTATNDKPSFSGGYSHWSTLGFFGRINYVYADRYLAEVSLRHNGSSRFVGDKTWGTFPSFSLGWNIANEAFFEPLKGTISMLKLRGSWGALGNTNTHALYPWALTLPITSGGDKQGAQWLVNDTRMMISNAPGLVSNTLTWERVESWNAGIDWAAFNNRFQGSFDYFVRSTKDMVGPASPMSSILGAKQPRQNNADLRAYGWELELRWRDQIGAFKYGAKFVLADSQVEITKFDNPSRTLSTWTAGAKMGEIWGFQTVGIAKTDAEMTEHLKKNQPSWGSNWAAGDVMYADLNGDGKVTEGAQTIDDHGDLRIIGNTTPRYSYSLNLDAAYKGFDFNILLQGVAKKDFWDNSPYSTGANHGMWQSAAFVEHWDFFRPEGDKLGANLDAFYPRPLFGAGSKNFVKQTRYLQNAAYLRIKNIQLGYTLPQSLVSKLGINTLRLYVSADNIATFTKMNTIFDPETPTGNGWESAGKLYPLQRTISFGVNVNL